MNSSNTKDAGTTRIHTLYVAETLHSAETDQTAYIIQIAHYNPPHTHIHTYTHVYAHINTSPKPQTNANSKHKLKTNSNTDKHYL